MKKSSTKARRSDGARSRQRVLDAALELFRRPEQGFDKTTMREIAKAAGLSLGAAYHYFPSKQAIAMGFYEQNHARYAATAEEILERETDLEARLAAIFHANLNVLRDDRILLRVLARRIFDPDDRLSAFSPQSRHILKGSLLLLERAMEDDRVAADLRPVAALGLWILQLGVLLYMAYDESPGLQRSHDLVDDSVAFACTALSLMSRKLALPVRKQLLHTLRRAGLLTFLESVRGEIPRF